MPSTSAAAHQTRDSVCPGDVLASKYRIERVLGEGGMCTVYAAEHIQLEDWVAVKVLHSEYVDRPDLVERFMREGRFATRIRSEHVVRTFDVGMTPEGIPYLVMEYLVGSDLDALVFSKGAVPQRAAVDYVLQAGEAIAEAHQLGIVHRDLKPANLFLTRRADGSPWVKVLDFGISKLVTHASRRDSALTGTHSIMGSPRYMSPEQMRSSRTVDTRTDIWSLGAILHELVAGSPAFEGDSMPEICAQILQSPVRPLSASVPKVKPELEAVVLRCLQKDASKRFANMGELAVALRDLGTPAGRASANRIVGIVNTGGLGHLRSTAPSEDDVPAWGSTDPSWRPGPRKRRRAARVLGVFAGSVVIMGIGAATGFYALRHTSARHAWTAAPATAINTPVQHSAQAPPPPPSAQPTPQPSTTVVEVAPTAPADAKAAPAASIQPGTMTTTATAPTIVPPHAKRPAKARASTHSRRGAVEWPSTAPAPVPSSDDTLFPSSEPSTGGEGGDSDGQK